jgi:hypothetical protein
MIQIDMPMPKSCVECRFSQGGYMYCHAMPENFCGYVNYCEEDGRPEWCPLKALENTVCTKERCQIEAEPVRHGKWIDENCSICGQYVYHGDARNYCPNCGARMEEK